MRAIISRLLGLVGIAATTANSDESDGAQTLQVRVLGAGSPAELRDPLPSAQHFGFASAPVPGAHHVVVFLGGDRTKGVAVASNDPRYRPTGMKPGEVMIYDNQGRQFYFSASGPIINCNGAPLNIIGDVMVNGKIIATGDIVGNGISLGDHEHGNGNNGGNTTPPIAGT